LKKSITYSTCLVACLALAAVALLLVSCAGTARGSRSSVFQTNTAVELADYSLERAGALVVIRYPAIIHADAEEPYFHAFSVNAIGGEVPPANRTKKVTTRIAQSVIAKSNYYVMSLYRELQRELPQDTVLLSPHIILWNPEHGVYSRPILATEQIPSVVTVDVNVYSYPARRPGWIRRRSPATSYAPCSWCTATAGCSPPPTPAAGQRSWWHA
jgi:hypothetical protein